MMDFGDALKAMIGLATGSNDPIALNAVMEVQRQLIEIQEENRILREELHDFKNERIISAELEYRDGVYKKGNEVYCNVCWDRDNKLSRLRILAADGKGKIEFVCDVCNKRRFSDITLDELQTKK